MNWRDVLGDVAATFGGFGPTELWAMSIEELLFWHAQAVRLSKRR